MNATPPAAVAATYSPARRNPRRSFPFTPARISPFQIPVQRSVVTHHPAELRLAHDRPPSRESREMDTVPARPARMRFAAIASRVCLRPSSACKVLTS